VGLNTGRPEHIRAETISSLNRLGGSYGVRFDNDLLYMNPYGWERNVMQSKIEGITHFMNLGYDVIAFLDNEPENLRAVSDFHTGKSILLLHADTFCRSSLDLLPPGTVSGSRYDVKHLTRHGTSSFFEAA
jgi:hypothetical protein